MNLGARLLLALLNVVVVVLGVAGVVQCVHKAGFAVGLRDLTVTAVSTRSARGLAVDDVITHVNGDAIAHKDVLERVLDARTVGEVVRVGVLRLRNDTVRTVPDVQVRQVIEPLVVRVALVRSYTAWDVAVTALASLLFWSLGMYVLVRQPADRTAQVFHLAMNAATGLIAATAARYTYGPTGLGQAVTALHMLGMTLLPALFIHFTMLFPRPRLPRLRRLVWIVYIVGAVLGIGSSYAFASATLPALDLKKLEQFADWFTASEFNFIVFSFASVASFIVAHQKEREQAERMKLRWVLFGAAVACMSYVCLWLLPEHIAGQALVNDWVNSFMAMASPITFTLAIVRYRALDVDLLISRSTVFVIVVAVLGGLYFGVLQATRWVLEQLGELVTPVPEGVSALAVAILFEPARRRVQGYVERKFFRTRYNLREAQRALEERAARCPDIDGLTAAVGDTIDETLAPECWAVAAVDPRGSVRTLGWSSSAPTIQGPLAHPEVDSYAICGTERWIEPGKRLPAIQPSLGELGYVCSAWIRSGAVDGFLLLLVGRRKAGTRYSVEDLELLRAAAGTAASAAERIRLQQDVLRREAEADQLRELDRLKSFFVSSVSHELKTPLTSIRMFAEMLESTRVDAERVQRYAGVIDAESQRLTRLIDNVLDFSKIERGVKEYRLRAVDLGDAVADVLQTMEYQLSVTGFTVTFDRTSEALPITADPDAIAGVLINLIGNAIKYSPDTRVVELRTFRQDGFAGVSVTDHGIGMAPGDLARIFEPFYRTTHGKAVGATGTGLGLALVKHAVDAHGGTIRVDSTPGHGTTFSMILPLSTDHEEDSADRGRSHHQVGTA